MHCPDPAWGANSAPADLLARFKGQLLLRGAEGAEGAQGREEGKWKGRGRKGERGGERGTPVGLLLFPHFEPCCNAICTEPPGRHCDAPSD